MAKSNALDVWLIASNTVYRGVPFGVVTDWAQQGRLAAGDKLRPAGTEAAWVLAGDHPTVSDYLFVGTTPTATTAAIAAEPVSMDLGWARPHEDEDDDVDMIPLIDVSLVLLIFFMLNAVVSVLSPVDVPQMKHGFEMKSDPESLSIQIDKRPNGDAIYSVGRGDREAEKADRNLESQAELLARLDVLLGNLQAAGGALPEVRIACHRDLPGERVHDLAKEMQRRKDEGKIGYYAAEVNEKSK